MKDRVCVPQLLQLYNMLEERFNNYLMSVQQSIYYSKRVVRKTIIARLVLTTCIKPTWFRNLFIDPYTATIRYNNKILEIHDPVLKLHIRNWYIPKNNNEFIKQTFDPNLHRADRATVYRIIKEVLGVDARTARLACLAKLACEHDVQYAVKYYATPGWYVRRLLNNYIEHHETPQNNVATGSNSIMSRIGSWFGRETATNIHTEE